MKPGSQRRTKLRKSEIMLKDLKEKGRLQFFFHSPTSELPVRDVVGRGKTEPHLEKEAENYCSRCYQRNNIVPFLRRDEKYLFLFTTCRNEKMSNKYRDKRFIVGFIEKKKGLRRRTHRGESWWAVQGPTKLFEFRDAYPLDKLTRKPLRGVKKLNKNQSEAVLRYFRGKRNILRKCLGELRQLKKQSKKRKNGGRGCA